MSISLPNVAPLDDTSSAVYFLHIPKTGGTTFLTFLASQYRDVEVCPAHLWSHLLALPEADLDRYLLFRGHFYAYLHRCVPRPMRYVTMLRDPIERALSHHGHVMWAPPHYLHRQAHEAGTFGAYLRDPELATTITNFQVKSLAMDFDPRALASGMTPDELSSLQLERRMVSCVPTMPIAEMLDIAKHRLAQMGFVGLTERLSESIGLICRNFGWTRPAAVESRNTSARRVHADEVSDDDLALLRELNWADQELYEFARGRFEADLARAELAAA